MPFPRLRVYANTRKGENYPILVIHRGTTPFWDFTLIDARTRLPVDLTNLTVITSDLYGPLASYSLETFTTSYTVTDAANGEFTVTMTEAQTLEYQNRRQRGFFQLKATVGVDQFIMFLPVDVIPTRIERVGAA